MASFRLVWFTSVQLCCAKGRHHHEHGKVDKFISGNPDSFESNNPPTEEGKANDHITYFILTSTNSQFIQLTLTITNSGVQ